MDWSPFDDPALFQDEHPLLPAAAEPESFSRLPGLNNSGRRLGRKISHKKSASDTFAFAAGQDFLSILSQHPPLDAATCHARHASTGADADGAAVATRTESYDFAAAPELPASDRQSQQALLSPVLLGSTQPVPAAEPTAASAPHVSTDDAPQDYVPPSGTVHDNAPNAGTARSNALDPKQLDPRKAKRILANRQSAQRSRMKRLQYISELEGQKSKAEAALKDLKSKVDRARRQQTGLSQNVESRQAELTALKEQLMHEQGVQACLSSYVQSLQLQLQQLQQQYQQQHPKQWMCTAGDASRLTAPQQQSEQASIGPFTAPAMDSYQYGCHVSEYTWEQQQQHCYQSSGVHAASQHSWQSKKQQQQQQWADHVQRPHSDQQQIPVMQLQQHADVVHCNQHAELHGGDGVFQQAQLKQAIANQHARQPAALSPSSICQQNGGHVCVQAVAAGQQQATQLSWQQQQQQQHWAPQHHVHHGMSSAVPSNAVQAVVQSADAAAAAAAAEAAGQPQQSSFSQGSGSVLMRGSLSEADIDSLLGLGPALGSGQLEQCASPNAPPLLTPVDSEMLLPADAELLLQDTGVGLDKDQPPSAKLNVCGDF